VRDAVFGNVGTLVSFRVGAADAEFLEKEFYPEFSALDLVNLPNFNIYLKLMVDGVTSRPFSATTLPPRKLSEQKSNRDKIIQRSRERYSRPREEIEEEIAKWSGLSRESSGKARADKEKGNKIRKFFGRKEGKERWGYAELGELGIEFKKPRAGVISKEEVKKDVPPAISLEEAMKRTPESFGRRKVKEINLQRLKEVIKESCGERKKEEGGEGKEKNKE